jgi:hypothetical protein
MITFAQGKNSGTLGYAPHGEMIFSPGTYGQIDSEGNLHRVPGSALPGDGSKASLVRSIRDTYGVRSLPPLLQKFVDSGEVFYHPIADKRHLEVHPGAKTVSVS